MNPLSSLTRWSDEELKSDNDFSWFRIKTTSVEVLSDFEKAWNKLCLNVCEAVKDGNSARWVTDNELSYQKLRL
jgi:hypothetical protein